MVSRLTTAIPDISYHMGAENHMRGILRPADIFKLSRHVSQLDEQYIRVSPHIAACSNNWIVLKDK